METIFPDHDKQATGYRGMFMVGWRQSASKEPERTGTVILKRTYDINPNNGTLAPSINPWPVFLSDYPDNLVDNGDFEQELNKTPGKPETWHFEPGTLGVARVADPLNPGKNHVLKVSGEIGGRIVQEIDLGEPLAGQEFMLTCSAWTDGAPVSLDSVQWEAEGATFKLPIEDYYKKPWNLEPKKKLFSSAGQWEKTDSEKNPRIMRVVLSAGLAAGRIVFYDDVKVFNALRFEHDLSSYKPEADIIVLGYGNILDGTNATISVDGKTWLERTVGSTNRRHLFGWMPRSKDNRKTQAGILSESPDAYPLKGLPEKFDNGFFNGYQRDHKPKSFAGLFPFLRSGNEIAIERVSGAQPYRFKLPGDKVSATYSYYDLTKPDTKAYWQSQSIPMNIDTLVIEPEQNQCIIVWRGVWNFDEHAEASYRRLEVLAST